jgi:hypothetical protein
VAYGRVGNFDFRLGRGTGVTRINTNFQVCGLSMAVDKFFFWCKVLIRQGG